MKMLWCRICERNVQPSEIVPYYLGCNVCGLLIREFFREPLPQQHPIHTRALKLCISDEYVLEEAMACYDKTSGHFEVHDCQIVAALCLYISCRANEIPLMLYDLSVDVGVSVYRVGLMFLDVCDFLSYEIDGFRPPDIVDPVLFIHRFDFQENGFNFNGLLTALRILAAFKSDYVGRRKRLGGLCAAAVYMAGGFDMFDVDNVFTAFQALDSEKLVKCSILDLDREFRSVAKEYKYLYGQGLYGQNYVIMENADVLCQHNVEKFSHGFCPVCYDKFVELSGYFSGVSDAPTDLGNDIALPREDKGKERLSSIINFDALRQMFGADVAQSTNTKREEPNAGSNTMEQGQAREENLGDELAN